MKITFENIMEKVINSQTISRKDKQNHLREFLKDATGKNKPVNDEQVAILEKLKALKKTYALMEAQDKVRQKLSLSA